MIPWWVLIPVGIGCALFGMILAAIIASGGDDR